MKTEKNRSCCSVVPLKRHNRGTSTDADAVAQTCNKQTMVNVNNIKEGRIKWGNSYCVCFCEKRQV